MEPTCNVAGWDGKVKRWIKDFWKSPDRTRKTLDSMAQRLNCSTLIRIKIGQCKLECRGRGQWTIVGTTCLTLKHVHVQVIYCLSNLANKLQVNNAHSNSLHDAFLVNKLKPFTRCFPDWKPEIACSCTFLICNSLHDVMKYKCNWEQNTLTKEVKPQ